MFTNIFCKSCAVTSPFITTPEFLEISPIGTCCSITIRAPVLSAARLTQALYISLAVSIVILPFDVGVWSMPDMLVIAPVPICSRAFLNSGWKIIITAITPTDSVFSIIHDKV